MFWQDVSMMHGLETRNAGYENGSKCRRVKSDASSKKLSVKDTILIFYISCLRGQGLYLLWKAGYNSFTKESRCVFFKEPALQCRRQSKCRIYHHWRLVQGRLWESWSRGPSGVRSINMGQTVGPSRYKTEDYLSCPVGTPVCMDGKYRCPDILFLSGKPTLYNPKPLRCLYKPEG